MSGPGGETRSETLLALSYFTVVSTLAYTWLISRNNSVQLEKAAPECASSYDQLIGNTPLVKLLRLSKLTGCDIYAKMESANPGGTGKDRAVQYMLRAARKHPRYREGVDIVEGTSGSTGISLALQCSSLGMKVHIVMPDDQSEEKRSLIEKLGATPHIVPCCSISNANHYVNSARKLADSLNGIFIDQFENEANNLAHYEVTGPELWKQTNGEIDAFIMSAGTGGTIAGVSRYLKEKSSAILTVLADPFGSSLLRKVLFNVCYTTQQSERTVRKHRYDSIVEGVGLDRVTKNFNTAKIDTGTLVEDQEIIDMAHWLLENEGLFVGSSSALNVVAAVRTANSITALQKGKTGSDVIRSNSSVYEKLVTKARQILLCNDSAPVAATKAAYGNEGSPSSRSHKLQANRRPVVVTVICDNGQRHLSRFWNPNYVSKYNLSWPKKGIVPKCIAEALDL